MASKALPNPSEGTTDKLLGQILSALEKQDKIKKNSDKILFYGQEEQTHQDEEHTKQLIETTGGKDKSKTIDEVADFAKEQTLSLKVQEELAEQEAQAKEDEKLFEEVKGKLGQIGESITNGLGNIVDKSYNALLHSTETGREQIGKGITELKNGIGVLGPIMNELKTVFHKFRAVFDVFMGFGRMALGVFQKTKVFFFGLSEKQQAEQDLAEAEEEFRKAEEDLIRQQQIEGQPTKHLDPLPLPVTMEGFQAAVGGVAEPDPNAPMVPGNPLFVGPPEEIDERSDALKKAEDRKISAEMILAQQKESYERDYNKQRKKGLKGFFRQGKVGFKKFFTQLSLMSIAKFLLPIAAIALLIYAMFTDLPGKLVDMADKAFGLNMPRYPEGHPLAGQLITEENKAFGMDHSESRIIREAVSGVDKFVKPAIQDRLNYKTTLDKNFQPSKSQKILESLNKYSKYTGPAKHAIAPFMIAADYGANNAKRLSTRAGIFEAYEQGMLFKKGPNGEPVPVTPEDMLLFDLLNQAEKSGDFYGAIADYGTSAATALSTAAVVSAVTPMPGGRLGALALFLLSAGTGLFVSSKLDDAGVNEMVRQLTDDYMKGEKFDELLREHGIEPATINKELLIRDYENLLKQSIPEENLKEDVLTSSVNVPVIQQQFNQDSNYYGNGPMDNPFLDISIEKPLYG